MICASLRGVAAAVFLVAGLGMPVSHAAEPKSAASEKSHSPEEVFRAMRGVFQTENAKGVHIRYLFHLTEPQGGDWWIIVNDGKMTMGKGTIEKPDCTISCTGADWVALDNDTLGGTRAYLTGRLRISGDRNLARKLNELFP
jgi:putative sterol carrier protein